jgi:hypothetical protein
MRKATVDVITRAFQERSLDFRRCRPRPLGRDPPTRATVSPPGVPQQHRPMSLLAPIAFASIRAARLAAERHERQESLVNVVEQDRKLPRRVSLLTGTALRRQDERGKSDGSGKLQTPRAACAVGEASCS